jgi:hypothetical protein
VTPPPPTTPDTTTEPVPEDQIHLNDIQFPGNDVQDDRNFEEEEVEPPSVSMSAEAWRCGLRETEINDNKQKLKARPWLAWGVGTLLVAQNLGIWFIIVWTLHRGQLQDLELIFSTLIAGTLTQSYFLLRLITEKVFGDINYHNPDDTEE